MECGGTVVYRTGNAANKTNSWKMHHLSTIHRRWLQHQIASENLSTVVTELAVPPNVAVTAASGGQSKTTETCMECGGAVVYRTGNAANKTNSWKMHHLSTIHKNAQREDPPELSPQNPFVESASDFTRKHRYPGQYEIVVEYDAASTISTKLRSDAEDFCKNNPYRRAIVARNAIKKFVVGHLPEINQIVVLEIRNVSRTSLLQTQRSISRRRFLPASWGVKREMAGALRYVVNLPRYPLPGPLAQVLHYDETERTCERALRTTSFDADPTRHLHNLLYCEEACVSASMREYDLEGVTFTRGASNLLRLRVKGLAEKRPSVLIGDLIEAIDATTNQCHHGYVYFVYHDEIDVNFGAAVVASKPYHIHFTCNRTVFRKLHRAVDCTRELGRPLLRMRDTLPSSIANDPFSPEPLARLNALQRSFVKNTCDGDSLLSVLWGPPGTGKTTTVVGYIASLATVTPLPAGLKILVATPSNGASNLIVSKLLAILPDDRIIRVMALTREKDEVPEDVRRCCRFTNDPTDEHGREATRFRTPDASEMDNATIIVATLGSCSTIYGTYPVLKFSHVIVDECGQATEPEFAAALQFSGLRRVVVAGDPKQLGPIVMSMAANRKGLGCSPLVRLIENEKCSTTMLNECYRCHPEVLQAFNPVFYEGKLTPATGSAVKFSVGPIPGFPKQRVQLIHCGRPESYDPKSSSIMNLHEVTVVKEHLSRLRTAGVPLNDIVILAPYALQVKELRKKLSGNSSWLKTNICSIEAFQGRESKVVILSCVRSPEEFNHAANSAVVAADVRRSLGFLSQPQRSNVALSRAIDGLIIVGNMELLWMDDRVWRPVLDALLSEGALLVATASERSAVLSGRALDQSNTADVTADDENYLDGDTTQHGIPRLEE
jgi:helicase MOV-10